MLFCTTSFDDVWLVELDGAHDQRGFFARTFCVDTFAARGLEAHYPQHSVSFSRHRGTVRGMHFQRAPHEEVKLVRCTAGAIWDVIVDLRPRSPTFRRWEGFELSAANRRQLYIPKGYAHGFQTLTDDVEVGYMISERYCADAAAGIRHDDPAIGIVWPERVAVISDKDLNWPDFNREL
jgi:dTDP-4-dehydrorhamnose 3,5-epimerase